MSGTEWMHGLHAVQALLERDPQRVLRLLVARGREDARMTALLAAACCKRPSSVVRRSSSQVGNGRTSATTP